MANESLNAGAAEFRPTLSHSQPQTRLSASSATTESRESKRRAPRSKKSNGDGANGGVTQQQQQQQNGEVASNVSLVPASVRRRRQPANGKASVASASAGSDGNASDAKPKAKKNAAPKPQNQRKQKTKQQEEDDDAEACLLCADPIQFYAVGECNHHGICSKCSLRMRMLMNDRNCPICKQHQERVVVSREKRDFESFQLWGDAAAGGRESVMDEASDIIFYECRSHYTTLRALRDHACRMRKCQVVCGSLQKLKDHLRIEHATEFCELCLTHQHFFIQEQQVFTKNGLRMHSVGKNAAVGPKASGKDFHPMCQFCKRRFYGDMQLYEHLERDHFRCHICKIDHDYFRNYSSLEAHFRRQHHLCEEPSCLENRYVVFPNDIEYHAHMRNIHGVLNRLVLNFQVARTGENPLGGPGVAEDVPDSWSYETQQPVATTHASQQETAFPALPASAAPAPPPLAQPAIAPRASIARASSAPTAAAPTGPPRAQIMRNQRLAEALGLARPGQSPVVFEQEMKTPSYPTHLVEWGKANLSYLLVVERRLERIVQDASCHSVSLRPMPADERKMMHELAEFYKVPSESFGEDPYRRIQFFKNEAAFVPEVPLSKVVRGVNAVRAAASVSRLSFLPMRGQQPPPAAAQARPARPPTGIQRGWEKIAPKPKKPVVADAWSDDEDDTGANTAVSGVTSAEDDEEDEEEEQKPAVKPVVLLPDERFDDEDDEDTEQDKQ